MLHECSNGNLGLYQPLPVPSRPWESISMEFMGGLSITKWGYDYLFIIVGLSIKKWGYDYLFIVVDIFSKMCVLIL